MKKAELIKQINEKFDSALNQFEFYILRGSLLTENYEMICHFQGEMSAYADIYNILTNKKLKVPSILNYKDNYDYIKCSQENIYEQ